MDDVTFPPDFSAVALNVINILLYLGLLRSFFPGCGGKSWGRDVVPAGFFMGGSVLSNRRDFPHRRFIFKRHACLFICIFVLV